VRPVNEPAPKQQKIFKKPMIVLMEEAYQVYHKGDLEYFHSFCDLHGIEEVDQNRIIDRHDRVSGLAMILNRENYPIKKKWKHSGKSTHFWSESAVSPDSL
ncbi:MAG: hypothetical protein GY718_17740, partial [Lentisphaerae bacterium]|nr:hypothetical protein [Lentisphaerota bacterium]